MTDDKESNPKNHVPNDHCTSITCQNQYLRRYSWCTTRALFIRWETNAMWIWVESYIEGEKDMAISLIKRFNFLFGMKTEITVT